MGVASDGFVVREAHGNVETLAYRAPYDYTPTDVWSGVVEGRSPMTTGSDGYVGAGSRGHATAGSRAAVNGRAGSRRGGTGGNLGAAAGRGYLSAPAARHHQPPTCISNERALRSVRMLDSITPGRRGPIDRPATKACNPKRKPGRCLSFVARLAHDLRERGYSRT